MKRLHKNYPGGTRRSGVALLGAMALVACQVPIDDQLWQCASSADCGAGWQCDPTARVCVEAFNNGMSGVYDDRLVIGMTAYLSQDIAALAAISAQGIAGIEAYFQHVNSTGGIHGRRLELLKVEDNFNPQQTAANVAQFASSGGAGSAFVVCNTLGEAPSVAAAGVAIEEKIILWSPGTGLGSLEPDPPSRYVFNYRPRYSDESRQLTAYLINNFEPSTPAGNIAVLAQGFDFNGSVDGSGGDVITGVADALGIQRDAVFYASYVLGNPAADEPARRILQWMADESRTVVDGKRYVGLVLGSVFDAGSGFIKLVSDHLSAARLGQPLPLFGDALSPEAVARLATVELRLTAHSAINTEAVRATLGSFGTYPWLDDQGQPSQRTYGAGLIISQVVPLATLNSSGALRYREHLAAFDPDAIPGEFSLESYLNMWMLGEALQAHGRDLTTETFIETLEDFSTDLGVGTMLGFSLGSHQATDRVWGLRLSDQLQTEWLGLLEP